MNIPFMKYIDEYLGRVLCFFLTIGKSRSKQVPSPEIVRNILLVKFWGMGSIILTSPAISTVKNNYPGARIHFLSFSSNAEILKLLPGVDEFLPVRLTNPFTFSADTVKTIFKLRKINFDLVFDFEFFTYYSAILTRLIKAKYSIGFDNHKNDRSRLLTKTVLFNDHIHTRDNFLDLVMSVCKDPVSDLKLTNISSPDAALGRPPEPLSEIIINPNASKMAFERRLPAKYFIKIIDELSAAGKHRVILTGAIEEKEYVSEIYNELKHKENVTDLSGKLSVNGLVALIRSSLCLISNDSGPLHIASALNKPVIAFYGPESPVRYGPLSSKQLVFYRGIECSPCMSISNSKTVNCIYSEPLCMTGFDINDIIFKTKEFISTLNEVEDTN